MQNDLPRKSCAFKWVELKPWVIAALVVLTASWAADGLREIVEPFLTGNKPDTDKLIPCLIYIVLFVIAVWRLYRIRQELFTPRTRFVKNEIPEKREHLILFLSNLPPRGSFIDGVPEGVSLTGELDRDLESLVEHKKTNPYWPWEMSLRGIKHHLNRFNPLKLIVICSPTSIQHVHWFRQVLSSYPVLSNVDVMIFVKESAQPKLIECPTQAITEGGWEFEKFDDLSDALMHLLRELKRRSVADDQIMIDFTSGQKVTSVVATAVTFNRNIKAQYVQTNYPFEVIGYDILLGSSETGGLGL